MIAYGAAFVLSFIFGLYWTPLIRKAALQLGIVDRPDGLLKKHEDAVPYLGGIAVFMAFLMTVGAFTDFSQETLGLLSSATMAFRFDLVNDSAPMNPWQRLLVKPLPPLWLK